MIARRKGGTWPHFGRTRRGRGKRRGRPRLGAGQAARHVP